MGFEERTKAGLEGSSRHEERIGGRRRVIERKLKGQKLEERVEKVMGSRTQRQQTAFGKFYL